MRLRILALLVVVAGGAEGLSAQTRPLIMGRRGVVVSGHHLASDAGLDILKRGGNAVDAGVATVFAQAVVEFDRFGFGGEVPMLIYSAKDGNVVAVNGHGQAPMAASIAKLRELGVNEIAGDCFMPAVAPAVLGSLLLALEERGTMSLGDVLAPALLLAEKGFPVYEPLRSRVEQTAPRFRSEWPSSARVFLPQDRVPEVGDLLIQADLARTFRRLIAAEAEHNADGREAGLHAARDYFYGGPIAGEIVDFQKGFSCTDQSGVTATGLLEVEDFARFRARIEEPARTTYRDVEVFKVGFWSQGPVLLQALNLLESYDLRALGHNTPEYVHLVAEAMKLAFADREWYYADPDFVGVPDEGLLSKAYAAERRKLIDLKKPSLEMRPGDPYPFHPREIAQSLPPATIEHRNDPHGTTGTRVIDAEGNIFSATPSGGWFPTSPIIPGLGFVLGTRGQAFWMDESKANRLEPGKRPRTTLTPSLALRGGKPFLAWGTPGGDVQDQANLQVLLNVVEFDMDLQEAIEAPLFQILDFPPSFYPRRSRPGAMMVEERVPVETVDALAAMGVEVRRVRPWSIGDVTAAGIDLERGIVFGAAGPRRNKSWAVAW